MNLLRNLKFEFDFFGKRCATWLFDYRQFNTWLVFAKKKKNLLFIFKWKLLNLSFITKRLHEGGRYFKDYHTSLGKMLVIIVHLFFLLD